VLPRRSPPLELLLLLLRWCLCRLRRLLLREADFAFLPLSPLRFLSLSFSSLRHFLSSFLDLDRLAEADPLAEADFDDDLDLLRLFRRFLDLLLLLEAPAAITAAAAAAPGAAAGATATGGIATATGAATAGATAAAAAAAAPGSGAEDPEDGDEEREEDESSSSSAAGAAAKGADKGALGETGVKGSKPQSRTRHRCSTPLGNLWMTSVWVKASAPLEASYKR